MTKIITSPIFDTDFYKVGHASQYPKGTKKIYSNMTPRSARLFKGSKFFDDKVVVIGLQSFVQEYLIDTWNNEFFKKSKEEIIEAYIETMDFSLGEGVVLPDHVVALHDLGYLPLRIKAIEEGNRVNIRVPITTITETISEFFWLVNYLETPKSSELWHPMTSATTAFEFKRIFVDAAIKTGSPVDFAALQGHDFSARGMQNRQSASKNIGHLLPFIGTDTISAIQWIKKYYFPSEGDPVGVSVPATEHSVSSLNIALNMIRTGCSQLEAERQFIKRLITEQYPTGIVSIVSDTYDYYSIITEVIPSLKEEIMSRQPNAIGLNKVVVRPDSGDPVRIICGDEFKTIKNEPDTLDEWKEWVAESMDDQFRTNLDAEEPHSSETELWQRGNEYYKVTYEPDLNRHDKQYYYVDNYGSAVSRCEFTGITPTPEQKGSIQCLWETFGGTITSTGHKLLDEHIGLIYGDSITLARAQEIMDRLADKGFASGNVVMGIGSYEYGMKSRDTFGFAIKATYAEVDDLKIDIYKDPKTGDGTKTSAKGLLRVEKEGDDYVLYDQQETDEGGELKVVFEDGVAHNIQTWDEIKARLNK
jgi:nicotinamide phosphoribosyltransferase